MNLDQFVREREPSWTELQGLVDEAGGRPERLGPERVRRLGALYRSAAADLAAARRRFPGELAVARLEQLVARARHVVYDADARRDSLSVFFGRTYWRRIRERPAVLALAAAMLFGPALLGGIWGVRDPGAASRFVPAQYRSVTEPRTRGTNLGLTPGQSSAMASSIFTNNIKVAVFAFAGGITLGLLTGYVLVFNGVLFGTLLGLAFSAGNGRSFTELVTPHGVLELSCILVAGVAGLRMGWAAVSPGHRRRSTALQHEAKAAAELALGTAPWLVLAGLVEGFVTPQGLGLGPALAVGLALGALYWTLVVLRGGPAPSTADTR
ncbi:MAG: hypothetical protein QOI20_2945 [Acidimicrobiaceae bacterium]|nr:hypothetical protein [Acidimicrobiaceae bacterium]